MYRAIVLEPESSGNIGFIARLAENFAVDELVLVDPQCNLQSEEAQKYASNAQDRLRQARQVDSLEQAAEDLDVLVGTTGIDVSEENILRNSITSREMTDELPQDTDIGILLGREGTGLSNEELERCDFVVRIPTSPEYEVMNLSHAASVLFYELYLHVEDTADVEDGSTSAEDGKNSGRTQRDVLENLFKDATENLDWERHRTDKTVRAFRNILGRSYATDREVALLLGAFREMRDRMERTAQTQQR